MTTKLRRLWAASDGNGGYDIGEGDFTIACVRNLRREDGAKVARAYSRAHDHTERETALLFRASPRLLAALEEILGMEEELRALAYADFSPFDNARAAIAFAKGGPEQ